MSKLLVLAETFGNRLMPSTQAAITFAQQHAAQFGGEFAALAIGSDAAAAANDLAGFGAVKVFAVSAPGLDKPTADRVAALAAETVNQYGAEFLVGASSTFGKDVLARAAGLLDAAMLTDVLSIEGPNVFKRPVFAGNAIATVSIDGPVKVLSIRTTAYGAPNNTGGASPVEALSVQAEGDGTTFVELRAGSSARPDLNQARVVVTGGRPLQNWENFEKYIGALADTLGGAIGATRAVVDAGIAPNELQVGQTGKIVAPELYIAAGVSGSIQHMAGIKDSKVIVAINKDPEAPIFEIADYGLVADLYEAIPELITKLKSS